MTRRYLIVHNHRNADGYLEQRCLGFVSADCHANALRAGFEQYHRDYCGLAAVPVNTLSEFAS
jgi:hypothetical protein